jgi:hypothetical protein
MGQEQLTPRDKARRARIDALLEYDPKTQGKQQTSNKLVEDTLAAINAVDSTDSPKEENPKA